VLQEITGTSNNFLYQCIHAGELLTKIKAKTKHGDWNDVLAAVELTDKTANRYMWLWEHRAKIDISKIKTLAEASELLLTEGFKTGIIPVRTSQHQPLTHEKQATSPGPVRSLSGTVRRADSTEESHPCNQQGTLKGSFQADKVPRDYSRAYVSGNGEPVPQRTKPRVSAKSAVEHGTDQMGWPLPDRIADHFKARLQIGMDRLRRLDALHAECMAEQDNGTADWKEVNKSTMEGDFRNLRDHLSAAIPYAVCVRCQGQIPETCGTEQKPTCYHRGWVSKGRWNNQTESDLREMRVKA